MWSEDETIVRREVLNDGSCWLEVPAELDIVIAPAGEWEWKDVELLDERVRDVRFTALQADEIRAGAVELTGDLDAGRHWWDPAWADWSPRVA